KPNPADLEMNEDMAPDEQVQSSNDEDIGSAHILTVNLRQGCVDDPILRHNVSKPLPLGGSPGQVTIQIDFFFNKDLEYLRYGSKGRRPALSIFKMKAGYYLDAGLEQMVPDQFWIEEECKYDIAAMYGISHWWFQRQRFYIGRHTSKHDRSTVRTHMRILSVVRIEVFSMYGYDYMKKIVLRCADLNEHVIAKRDFNAYKTSSLGLRATRLRAVIFRDKYGVQMMMRVNEIHKFSNGTLQQIDEALDYRVKEFRINRLNPGEIKKEKSENKGRVPTEMELELEHTQQASSYEVSSFTRFYRLSHSELVDIEKVAVCSSLRSPKSKCTIESKAKRSSKIISLGHDSTLLASSHTVKSKTDIKSPTHYPCGIARTSE
nr:hypothetical protein [Tanacetum cinerariifolium]